MDFYRDIVRDLGPRSTAEGSPSSWQSYMTDDFSPIEFGWKWSNAETDPQPVIRFSIEAIGDDCGTLNDPYNKVASFSLINRLKARSSNTDFKLFDHLSAALLPEINRDIATSALTMHGHQTTHFGHRVRRQSAFGQGLPFIQRKGGAVGNSGPHIPRQKLVKTLKLSVLAGLAIL